jgi:hypothetical protein
MPAKSKKPRKSVRLIRPGDIIKRPDETTEVVRNVTVVLHMANGVSDTYESTETVEVTPPEEVPEAV